MPPKKHPKPAPVPVADMPAAIDAGGDKRRELTTWYYGLVERAERGDRDALQQVQEAQAAVPRLAPQVNILQSNAERSVLDSMVPDKQLYSRKMIEVQLADMRRELAGDHPSPLESLLVNRIVLCWLDSMAADTLLSQRMAAGCSLELGEFYQRRAERAQRQYLRAVQTYATVRLLLTPVAQLNVADKQINVAR